MEFSLDLFKQNNKLPIRLVSPDFGRLSPEESSQFGLVHRRSYFFLLLVVNGSMLHRVDLEEVFVSNHDVLVVLPHQVHELLHLEEGADYFKIGFDESCLSLLPRQYPFLVNPSNMLKVSLQSPVAVRIKAIFGILLELLSVMTTDPELILAYLNSLLTEVNNSYFTADRVVADNKLSTYIDFKVFVENNLTDHPSIKEIAEALAVNTNSLYSIVKQYSGLSPKAFITNRLILEARRRLFYGDNTSIKELAFELGFNDPDYFSRLFKKVTGKSISDFFQDLSG